MSGIGRGLVIEPTEDRPHSLLAGKVAWAPDYGWKRIAPDVWEHVSDGRFERIWTNTPPKSPILEPPMYFPGANWAAERAYV